MPRPKEDVLGYADDVYLMWLKNHIDYIKSIVEHLEGIYSVYLEIKEDADSDFGWIASDEFIEAMNEMKKYLTLAVVLTISVLLLSCDDEEMTAVIDVFLDHYCLAGKVGQVKLAVACPQGASGTLGTLSGFP